MTMVWHLAPSLVVLRNEINARWPGRDRTSDGSIGDDAHSSRSSDHNPNKRDSVNAIDIDEDGVNMAAIKDAIQRHPSAHYWIYERRIADRDNGWRPVYYDGDNPHDKHLHVSIRQTRAAEDNRRPWGLAGEDDDVSLKEQITLPTIPGVEYSSDTKTGEQLLGGAYGYVLQVRNQLAVVAANQQAMLGKDWFNEQAVVDGVLAGLGGKDLGEAATALQVAFGPERAAELGRLLASPAS